MTILRLTHRNQRRRSYLAVLAQIAGHVRSFNLFRVHYGARAGSRTLNLGIKSPLLCQLSYASVRKKGRMSILRAART